MTCLIGIERPTAPAIMMEVGDFKQFPSAERFASYLGLVPGEHSGSE